MNKVTRPCCSAPCDRPAETKVGLCLKHYKRWKRRGTTHDITPEDRFFSYIKPVPEWDSCWVWTNRLLVGGYGYFWVDGTGVLAHRWVYEFMRAPIPDGLKIDHLCSNPPCVNPWHLEPVTQRVNLHRSQNYIGINARKTHCINGHEFDLANTYYKPGNGARGCRICRANAKQRYASKKK